MALVGVCVLIISLGSFLSSDRLISPSYFCFDLVDSRTRVLYLQLIGLGLDTAIVVLTWRTLTWSRTARAKLHTLGTGLTMTSLSTGLIWLGMSAFLGYQRQSEAGSGPFYGPDILISSVVFTTFMLSATVWASNTSPLLPSSAITVVLGLGSCMSQVLAWGDWLHFESQAVLVPFWLISGGGIFFLYFHDTKHLFFLRRILLVLLLLVATIGATIHTARHRPQTFVDRHPITDIIYKSQAAHDRWIRNARVSESLSVAVATYEERHPGKLAPPNFSKWYSYAKGTVVIDDFQQIDSDLTKFWNVNPEVLREGVEMMASLPDTLTIYIKGGKVTHGTISDGQAKGDIGDLVDMISKFSEHLPDMTLPVNLGSSPRILPSWDAVQSHGHAGLGAVVDLFSKRSVMAEQNSTIFPLGTRGGQNGGQSDRAAITPNEYRQMLMEGCSPFARARAVPRWGNLQFCADCAAHHSEGSLLTSWKAAMETCSQSDLKYLHGLYLSSPQQPPIRELLPLFSLAKTDSFSDILIPLPRAMKGGHPDVKWQFSRRYDTLFWKGSVVRDGINDQYLRGNHKLRLLHLLEDPGLHDEAMLVLPVDGDADTFAHERVGVREASSAAPISVEIGDLSACESQECDLIRQTYSSQQRSNQEPLEYRYILVLDEDDGPPTELVRTLRSGSVPLVSTIFQTWYTERIQPWLHFVPIDLRYQGLHTTYLYFTGTERRTKIKGRDTNMKGKLENAEWIAQEGRKWVDKALGERDMEVYLFRLLLEWGRLIDDQRDNIGFRRSSDGGFDDIGFTEG